MEDIRKLRKRIDEVDEQILHSLSERTKICAEIGLMKKEQGLPIKDGSREKELFLKVKKRAAEMDLNIAQVEAVYRKIVAMCTSVQ
jgi:chorismate mutase